MNASAPETIFASGSVRRHDRPSRSSQCAAGSAHCDRARRAPAALLATKWEAFLDRGGHDPYGSHDLEDLLMLIAGRPELANELQRLSPDVGAFIAASARMLLAAPWFDDVLEGTFPNAQRLLAILEGVRLRLLSLTN